MSQTIDENGHAKLPDDSLDDNVVSISTRERLDYLRNAAKNDSASDTSVELMQRRLDTVDLVVQGISIRAIADRHDIDYANARKDYFAGMQILNDRTADMVIAMRDEVSMRQRMLIATYMPLALAGDDKAAKVVAQCDNTLIGLWGLRSAKLEIEHSVKDPSLSGPLDAYLRGVIDASSDS